MAVKIQLRRGTEAEFDSANTTSTITPADGEVLVVQESGTTGGYLLIGNGSSNYVTLRDDVDGRVYFKSGYSKTVMGGEQPAGSTPLTVKGATSQTAAILKVTNQGDSSILEIYDDEGPTIRLEDHGDAGEVFLQLKQQASQTGNALELKAAGGADQMTISCDGEVAITPTNNQTADAPSLDVKGSAATQNNGILRVQASDGSTNLFRVLADSTNILKSAVFGSTPSPDHTDPSFFGRIQTATTPNNTDSGAADDVVVDFPHYKMVTVGSGTAIRGKIELAGNSAAGTFNALAVVKNGAAPTTQAQINYSGKGEFRDLEITQTGRTQADASILRADEIFNRLSPFSLQTSTITDSDYNETTLKLLPISLASGSGSSFGASFTGEMADPPTLHQISGTGSNPETGEPGTSNDTTNFYLIKVPANSGAIRISYSMSTVDGRSFTGFQPAVIGTRKIFRYTSLNAATNKTEILSTSFNQSSTATSTSAINISNLTFDAYYGFAFDGDHDTGDLPDTLNYFVKVERRN